MDIMLKPVLERMRVMQRTAEQLNAPISMSAADYKAVADHIETLERIIGDVHEAIGEDRNSDDDSLADTVRKIIADLKSPAA